MQVIKVLPSGFCYGVHHSYTEALKVIAAHPQQTIYFLGWLVHNQNVINELTAFPNVILLNDQFKSRYELVEQLAPTTNDILILSAHGTARPVIDLALAKGYQVVDLTCKFVYQTHTLIQQHLNRGYHIIFVGTPRHPETLAVSALTDQLHVISKLDDINQLPDLNNTKLFCTNQTTFNHQNLVSIISALRQKFPNIEFKNDICQATQLRQTAVLNLDKQIDICLVIGDQQSNNARELVNIITSHYQFPVYLINHCDQIQASWFTHKQCCGLVSAASTPQKIVDEIATVIAKF